MRPLSAALAMMAATTWDLPVPGGPVITVRGAFSAALVAWYWSSFSGNGGKGLALVPDRPQWP